MPRSKKPPSSTVALTVSKTAAYLGCSNVHVYRLIKANLLPAIDISTPESSSTKTRILLEDLQNFLASAPTPALRGINMSHSAGERQPTHNVATSSQSRMKDDDMTHSTTLRKSTVGKPAQHSS